MRQLQGLTSVRFFAALWVVLFHLGGTYAFPKAFTPVIGVGYAGVSLFFVLSGFILTYNYLPRPFSKSFFWKARFARIWPVYAFALVTFIPIFIHSAIRGSGLPSRTSAVAVLTLTQAWLPESALAWNPPGWSLSCEAFFYVLFPFAVYPAAKLFRARPLSCFIFVWALSAIPMFAYIYLGPEGIVTAASKGVLLSVLKFNPALRAPEFLLGVFLGIAYLDGFRMKVPRLVFPLAIGTVVAILYFGAALPYPMFHNGLLAPVFAVVIMCLATDDCGLGNPRLVFLGESSYSLYLLHAPVIQWMSGFGKRAHLSNDSLAFVILSVVASVTASMAAYKLVEIPGKKLLLSKFSNNVRTAPPSQALKAAEPIERSRTAPMS